LIVWWHNATLIGLTESKHQGRYTVNDILGRVRCYIGYTPETNIARKVLECSIGRRTDACVDFVHMSSSTFEYDMTKLPKEVTPYNLRRWMIPRHCNWQGMAIYLNADCLMAGDIWHLWTQPNYTATCGQATVWCPYVGGKPCTDVMLIDCAKARNQWCFDIDAISKHLRDRNDTFLSVQRGVYLTEPPVRIDSAWLHEDVYDPGRTKILRYTNSRMYPYPWLSDNHPCAQPWELEFCVAIGHGFVPVEILKEALSFPGKDPRSMHPEYARFIPLQTNKRRKAEV
jgi:hypothetical protein